MGIKEDIENVIMPCDICEQEPAEWVGTENKGMFLCEDCQTESPEDLFAFALSKELYNLNWNR